MTGIAVFAILFAFVCRSIVLTLRWLSVYSDKRRSEQEINERWTWPDPEYDEFILLSPLYTFHQSRPEDKVNWKADGF